MDVRKPHARNRPTRHSLVRTAAMIAALSCVSLIPRASAQSPRQIAAVRIGGQIAHPRVFVRGDLAAISHRKLEVRDEKGTKTVYEGVAVVELLRRAGVPLGMQLRGAKLKLYVLVEARDGYQVLFALPEFDPGFTDNVIVLADARDGKPLTDAEGPLRLVVPGDKRHARWVRQVSEITVQTAPSAGVKGLQ